MAEQNGGEGDGTTFDLDALREELSAPISADAVESGAEKAATALPSLTTLTGGVGGVAARAALLGLHDDLPSRLVVGSAWSRAMEHSMLGITRHGALAVAMGLATQAHFGELARACAASVEPRSFTPALDRAVAATVLPGVSAVLDGFAPQVGRAFGGFGLAAEGRLDHLWASVNLTGTLSTLSSDIVESVLGTRDLDGYIRSITRTVDFEALVSPLATVGAKRAMQAWVGVVDGEEEWVVPRSLDRIRLAGSASAAMLRTGASFRPEDDDLAEPPIPSAFASQRRQMVVQLGVLHPSLPDRLQGAWDRVEQAGPDALGQAANSAVELIDLALRCVAPDSEALAWHAREGHRADLLHEGRPTRRLRAAYATRDRPGDEVAAQCYLDGLSNLMKALQGAKHGPDGRDVNGMRRLIPAVEAFLGWLLT